MTWSYASLPSLLPMLDGVFQDEHAFIQALNAPAPLGSLRPAQGDLGMLDLAVSPGRAACSASCTCYSAFITIRFSVHLRWPAVTSSGPGCCSLLDQEKDCL